jgi:hypothetical protein
MNWSRCFKEMLVTKMISLLYELTFISMNAFSYLVHAVSWLAYVYNILCKYHLDMDQCFQRAQNEKKTQSNLDLKHAFDHQDRRCQRKRKIVWNFIELQNVNPNRRKSKKKRFLKASQAQDKLETPIHKVFATLTPCWKKFPSMFRLAKILLGIIACDFINQGRIPLIN